LSFIEVDIMTTIVADAGLQSTLATLSQVTEIRTPDGRLMGTFTPATAVRGSAEWEELYRHARTLFDPEEIKRRKEANEPSLPLSAILQYLDALEPR
jgi:hypothetical protein